MRAAARTELDTDRWASALHNLYLVALLIAAVVTAVEFTAGRDRVAVGVGTLALALADVPMRSGSVRTSRSAVGYFLAAGAVVSAMTAVFPTFSLAVFGLSPLVFARLPAAGAVAVGAVAIGLRYLVGPPLHGWLRDIGWEHRFNIVIRPWTVYFILDTIALPVLIGLFTAWAMRALRRQNLHRQALLDQLSATRAELASASRLAGRAEERQRLAHELHDTLAQGLTGVVLQLAVAEQQLESRAAPADVARLTQPVTRARELAGACLVDTRRTVEALRPEPLDDATLSEAIAQVCDRWTEVTGIRARYAERGASRPCHPRVQVVALRVVQEALANTAKHAGAKDVKVTVEHRDDDGLRVVVCDDGRGFDPADTPSPDGRTSGGLGLVTMRERVVSVRGSLSVTSAPDAGTTVAATLPTDTGEHP